MCLRVLSMFSYSSRTISLKPFFSHSFGVHDLSCHSLSVVFISIKHFSVSFCTFPSPSPFPLLCKSMSAHQSASVHISNTASLYNKQYRISLSVLLLSSTIIFTVAAALNLYSILYRWSKTSILSLIRLVGYRENMSKASRVWKLFSNQAFDFACLLQGLVIWLCLRLLLSGLPWCVSCISFYQRRVNQSNLIVPFVMQQVLLCLVWLKNK